MREDRLSTRGYVLKNSWLIACERSGVVRRAFRDRGIEAWSCDLELADDGSPYHLQCDVREVLNDGWHGMIAHPVCRRLANSGRRWLINPPPRRTRIEMWRELVDGCQFYLTLRDAPIKKKAIENPVMHDFARTIINPGPRQVVQPWWFGDPTFKATGFELINLPPLIETNRLTPPEKGTKEHDEWSWVHRCPPGPDRERIRSETQPGIARAMAEQWG